MRQQTSRQHKRRRTRTRPAHTTRNAERPAVVPTNHATTTLYEAEVLRGLEEYARLEMKQRLGGQVRIHNTSMDGRIELDYSGAMRHFDGLRTLVAVHRVESFAVPRPKALLGHQHLTQLLRAIRSVLDGRPPGSFQTFRITAAGGGSAVFRRLQQELVSATTLESTGDAAHLHIAVRRTPGGDDGWQALIRTTAMPLSARRWRVCDMPGALNATIASVMVSLAGLGASERMLNVCCGSGTLMVERLGMGNAKSVTGVDISPAALQCADANLRAAGHRSSVRLLRADCAALPLPSASADTITADLPYGMLNGNGGGGIPNLYRSVLAECARVAAADASLILITTRKHALQSALETTQAWQTHKVIPVSVPYRSGYITPQIYWLRKA